MSITWWDYTFCHILYENVTFFIDTAFASDKMLLCLIGFPRGYVLLQGGQLHSQKIQN